MGSRVEAHTFPSQPPTSGAHFPHQMATLRRVSVLRRLWRGAGSTLPITSSFTALRSRALPGPMPRKAVCGVLGAGLWPGAWLSHLGALMAQRPPLWSGHLLFQQAPGQCLHCPGFFCARFHRCGLLLLPLAVRPLLYVSPQKKTWALGPLAPGVSFLSLESFWTWLDMSLPRGRTGRLALWSGL